MRGHVDEQTLAAFRENLLPKRKTARVAAHLSSCPRCAEIDAQLAAVTAILARTPAPPMPASLAARLDAALAAEIARSAMDASPSDAASPATAASPAGAASPSGAAPPDGSATPDGAAAPNGTATPAGTAIPAGAAAPVAAGRDATGRRRGRARAPWRLSPRLAAAAAAVVLIAGGGYAIVRAVSGGNTTAPSSSSGASAGSGELGGPSPIARPPAAAPGAAVEGGLPLIASGTDYRAGQLPAQVSAVLKRYPAKAASPGVAQPAFPRLAACVSHLAGGQRPRLVDIARYDARPAAVIVVPVPGSAMVRVWVVGPGCSGHGGDVIARFSLSAPG